MPLKVTNGKDVKISAICRAIYGGIDDFGCQVLNLSLGVSTDYESLREAVDYAEEKGVIIVAASGNDGTSTLYYPAGYDSVIGVSAVDRNGSIYLHSSHNSGVSIAVPGVDLRSTGSAGGYAYFSGTSFAVPQVSGAAAVLLGIDPTLTPAQVLELLTGTATDRGDAGYDKYYGCGILNLGACVEALTGGTIPLPDGHSEEVTEPSEWKTGYQDCLRDDSCELSAYSDLDSRNWYHDGIHFCLENGMMKGMGDGIFDPNGATSRAMIVTILNRLEGEPDMAGEEGPFSDVEDGQWYADAVIWAAENGIVEGYDDSTFRPTAGITREQLAVILYRYARSKGDGFTGEWEFSLHYPDATEISSWADEAIRWMVMKGVVGGKDGKLAPGGEATRAESATILMRYCMSDVE